MKDVIMADNEIECKLNNINNIIGGKNVMSKHFLAIMFLVFTAAGIYSQSIPSGNGRYNALGNSPFILDASVDIFNNPAWNNYYRDYAFGDLNQNGEFNDFDGNAGVTFAVGKKWNLGMIINRRQDSWFNFFTDSTYRPGNTPIVPFMGLIGTSVNKNFHVGLAPYVSMGKSEFTSTDTNATTFNNSSSSLGANLGFMYMMKKGWVEGTIRFRMNKFKNESTTAGVTSTTENDGGIELGVNLRGWFYGKGKKIAIVPVLGFNTYSFKPTSTSGSTSVSGLNHSWMNVMGGVGLNWPIMDDIQIAGGVTVAYNTAKTDSGSVENKRVDFVAPGFNMALETRIADWITARAGFNKSVDMRKDETTTTTFTNNLPSDVSSTVSLGAGFHFGRFSIDATVSERWLKRGPFFISGANSGEGGTDMFGILSASYNFAK